MELGFPELPVVIDLSADHWIGNLDNTQDTVGGHGTLELSQLIGYPFSRTYTFSTIESKKKPVPLFRSGSPFLKRVA